MQKHFTLDKTLVKRLAAWFNYPTVQLIYCHQKKIKGKVFFISFSLILLHNFIFIQPFHETMIFLIILQQV